ncbi:MAG: hypothetical protein LBH30_00880, partial [Prevotellaceae bacterium]|nr:hypothetical protein [Prevotellaceae bacterium]
IIVNAENIYNVAVRHCFGVSPRNDGFLDWLTPNSAALRLLHRFAVRNDVLPLGCFTASRFAMTCCLWVASGFALAMTGCCFVPPRNDGLFLGNFPFSLGTPKIYSRKLKSLLKYSSSSSRS